MTLEENAGRIRAEAAPQAPVALRNAVLTLPRATRAANIAAALRDIAWQGTALAMLGITVP